MTERRGGACRAFFSAATIRANLLWLVAACMLPGLLGAAFLLEYVYQRERGELEQNLLQTARALGQAVDRELAIARTATELLSGGPFFVNEDLALAHQRASDLVSMQVSSTMVLGNRAGQQVFNTRKPFGTPLPDYGNPEQLRRVFESGQPDVSNIFAGAVTRSPVISVAVPVRQGGKIKYVLSAGLLPERFEKILTAQHLRAGQIAAILDGNGTIIARNLLSEKYVGQRTTPAILQRMQEADEGIVEAATSDGVPSYIALSRLPGGWWVGVAAPKSRLLGEMRTIVSYLGLGILALLVAGILVARILGRRIANSVHALVAPALALGSGQPAAAPSLPIKETDEVARALNAASDLISQRTVERDRAFDSIRLAQSVFDNTQESIVVTDLSCNILVVNPAFSAVTEYSAEEAVGRHMSLVQSGRHDRSFYQQMWQSIRSSGGWQGAIWNRRKSGDIYQEWLVVSTARDAQGQPAQYVGIGLDMARMNHVETHMEYLAHHDALTDLPNRLLLHSRLEHTLERAHRDGSRCAVLYVDLDRFKQVNDSWGHAAGDELLQQAVERMGERLREVDTLARLGGDEFIVVLDSIASAEGASGVAQALIEGLCTPFHLRGGQIVRIGGSIGISLFPEHGDSASVLIENADSALYQAKEACRGNWRIYQPAESR
ncbi:MAG: diguanylate cyclase [Rhodocyclaceae bacterium]